MSLAGKIGKYVISGPQYILNLKSCKVLCKNTVLDWFEFFLFVLVIKCATVNNTPRNCLIVQSTHQEQLACILKKVSQ